MSENGPKTIRKKKKFFHDARDIVMMPCVRYWKNPIKTAGDIVVRTDGQTEGRTEGRKDGAKDGRTDGHFEDLDSTCSWEQYWEF